MGILSGNFGIAMGAGAEHWEKMQDSAAKNAYYAANTAKTNAETQELLAKGQERKDLGTAVDAAMAGMYGATKSPTVSSSTPDAQNAAGTPVDLIEATKAQTAATPADQGKQPVQASIPAEPNDFTAWRKTAYPKIVSSFVKAGNPGAAKATMDFFRGEEGEQYGSQWLKGMKAYEAGDYDAAIPHFTSLYNTQRPDGRRISFRSSGDGTYLVDHIDDQSGSVVATRSVAAKDLAGFGLNTMSPASQIKWRLDAQNENDKYKRDIEKLGKQEEWRWQREQDREDRRDDRMDKRLEHQDKMLDKRLNSSGGLTLPQQRGNEEIEFARQQISTLTPDEIKKKTAKFTTTGRENPDYDPTLERSASLANRRKIGDDPVFDGRFPNAPQQTEQQSAIQSATQSEKKSVQQSVQQPTQQPIQNRFGSDAAMKGHKLGNQTAKGYEVFDSSGKLVGHYK